MSAVIEVRELAKSFHTKQGILQALKGISFSVQQGEVFAFLGPNGSGKTTTLNILSGLLMADSGSALINGKSFGQPGYFQGVSFMSGDSDFMGSFIGRDLLKFYANLGNVPWSRVQECIDKFDFGSKLGRRWMQYSNGQKTVLRLIRALMTEPTLLFLDEPTVGLDPDAAQHFRESLKEINAQGTTIVLTSHYMRDIEELADTVCFIHQGEIESVQPLAQFSRLQDRVAIEFENHPDVERFALTTGAGLGEWQHHQLGHQLLTDLSQLREALAVGHVKSVNTVERSLEEYFVQLTRGAAR